MASLLPSLSEKFGADATLPQQYVDFMNIAWTRYHAVAECERRLAAAGFQKLNERDQWTDVIQPGGRYFFDREGTSLVAFAVGAQYAAGNGLIVVGTHTDSPHLRLKPTSKMSNQGVLQMGLQTYGGGLWSTWFDRDLSLAGSVVLRGTDGALQRKLLKIERPICRVPMLAVHLDRGTGTKVTINTETHLPAVLATSVKNQLFSKKEDAASAGEGKQDEGDEPIAGSPAANHHSVLLNLIAEELNCAPGDIMDFDLQLCDTQPSAIGGVHDEFIFSGRMDNLFSVYCATEALLSSSPDEASLADETCIRMVCAYDHEEVGSRSHQGAMGTITKDAVRRVTMALTGNNVEAPERATQASLLISSDMAHAVHPNYASKHEARHGPKLHGGVVIKTNVNQRYATTAITSAMFKEFAKIAGCPVQEFVVRQDCGCGSTIGPIVAGATGLRTVDVGAPQWSMHSIRETAGTDDVIHKVRTLRAAFENYKTVGKLFCGICKSQSSI